MTSRNTQIRKLVKEEFIGLTDDEKNLIKRFIRFMKKNNVNLISRDKVGFEVIRGEGLFL